MPLSLLQTASFFLKFTQCLGDGTASHPGIYAAQSKIKNVSFDIHMSNTTVEVIFYHLKKLTRKSYNYSHRQGKLWPEAIRNTKHQTSYPETVAAGLLPVISSLFARSLLHEEAFSYEVAASPKGGGWTSHRSHTYRWVTGRYAHTIPGFTGCNEPALLTALLYLSFFHALTMFIY